MSTSSSEEGSRMAGHHTTSSGLESTGSFLSALPSDSSDIQTEITPPPSPTFPEGEKRTPRDILDASRRLGQKSALASKELVTPSKPRKYCTPSEFIVNDEAGYDADADADGDEIAAGIGSTAATRPIRRPVFPRIDTRQHRRVASMLATRRPTSPEPAFGNDVDVPHPPRAKLVASSSIRLKSAAGSGKVLESYELRRRPRVELVGLGIGFPENHPLRSRASTMPAPTSASPISDHDEPHWVVREIQEQEQEHARQFKWLTSSLPTKSILKKSVQAGVHAPSPVRLTLRPTFLEPLPSPIECLPARSSNVEKFRCDGVHDRSEMERERYRALAREGRRGPGLS